MKDGAAGSGIRRAATEQRQRRLPGRGDGGPRVVPRELAQLEPSVLDVRADEKVFDRGKVGTRLDHARADSSASAAYAGDSSDPVTRASSTRGPLPAAIGGPSGRPWWWHPGAATAAATATLNRSPVRVACSASSTAAVVEAPPLEHGQRPRDGQRTSCRWSLPAGCFLTRPFVVAHASGLAQRHGKRLHLSVQPTHFERGASGAPLLERPARLRCRRPPFRRLTPARRARPPLARGRGLRRWRAESSNTAR